MRWKKDHIKQRKLRGGDQNPKSFHFPFYFSPDKFQVGYEEVTLGIQRGYKKDKKESKENKKSSSTRHWRVSAGAIRKASVCRVRVCFTFSPPFHTKVK